MGMLVTVGHKRGGLLLAVCGLAFVLSSCSSTPTSAPTLLAAGQLPKSAFPTGKAAKAAESNNTVPLAKQNPTTAMFTAIGVFQSCLSSLGTSFIGIPGQGGPNSPANNPTYIKNLTTCAAQSNIVQALKAEQSAQDNLTAKQVKVENQDYLKWRTCMIGRGWQIPTPTPNAKGLLFSFGGSGGGGSEGGASGFKPPPGQNLLSSPDMSACAAKAQAGGSS
jgi:hypothetical protein